MMKEKMHRRDKRVTDHKISKNEMSQRVPVMVMLAFQRAAMVFLLTALQENKTAC